jgi:6,7-dimethyl-8-ribityllumazine synthase
MNILIVESRYHPAVSDALADGATAALEKGGAQFERVSVPGALEIPTAIVLAARTHRFEGYVALGSVVRDENHQFEIIARESAGGLMRLATDHGHCIGNGIVAANSEGEALRLAQEGDAGGDAARACLSLVALKGRLT